MRTKRQMLRARRPLREVPRWTPEELIEHREALIAFGVYADEVMIPILKAMDQLLEAAEGAGNYEY